MQMLTCKVMRSVVVVAAVMFSFGALMQLPAIVSWLQPQFSIAFLSYIGLVLMLMSPLILLVSAVVFSIPVVSHKLDSCQH